MNAETLVEWTEGGFAMDLSKATNEEFKQLVADIPESFNLTDGTANYGIPYNVEGYGYIVDKEMLAALFGEDQVDAFLEAFKTATYDEFEQMVLTLQSYIKEGTAGSVTLSGQEFALAAEKTGKAATLEGVFSVAGSEKWTYGDHFVNIAADAIFPGFQGSRRSYSGTAAGWQGCIRSLCKGSGFKDRQCNNPPEDRN